MVRFFFLWSDETSKKISSPLINEQKFLPFLDSSQKMINSYRKVFRSDVNSGPRGVNGVIPGYG